MHFKNKKHELDKIFTCEGLHHYKASGKNSSSGRCCYGNRNSFIVTENNSSVGGRDMEKSITKNVPDNHRHNSCIEHFPFDL